MPTAQPTGIGSTEVFGTPDVFHIIKPGPQPVFDSGLFGNDPNIFFSGEASECELSVQTFAQAHIETTLPEPEFGTAFDIRAMAKLYITMPDPAVRRGVPYIPMCRGHNNLTVTCDGNENFPSPYNNTSGQMWQWDTTSLGAVPYSVSDWSPNFGSAHWLSSGSYRPRAKVRKDIVYSRENHQLEDKTTAKALHFRNKNVDHMWLDLGAAYSTLTVMIVARVDSDTDEGHYLLDAGKASPSKDLSVDDEYNIDDGVNYRAAIIVKNNHIFATTVDDQKDKAGKTLRIPREGRSTLRLYYAVFNGNNSVLGARTFDEKHEDKGELSAANIRYLVLGRKRNKISTDHACNAAIYDVRIFDTALSDNQLRQQWRQIKKMYDIGAYRTM